MICPNIVCLPWIFWVTGFCAGELKTIGPALTDRIYKDMYMNKVAIPNPADRIRLKVNCRVNSFKFYARVPGKIHLQVWRPTGKTKSYRLMATTGEYSARKRGIHTVIPAVPMTVHDGDVIALYTPGLNMIPFRYCNGNGALFLMNPKQKQLVVGSVSQFSESSLVPCLTYSLQVIIEIPEPLFGQTMLINKWILTTREFASSAQSLLVPAIDRIVCVAMCRKEFQCKSFTFSGNVKTCSLNKEEFNLEKHKFNSDRKAGYYIPKI